MSSEATLRSLLVLNQLSSGQGRQIFRLLQEGTLPESVLARIEAEDFLGKRSLLTRIRERFDPRREMDACADKGIRCLTVLDQDYPQNLLQIPDPPLVLYVKGSLLKEDQAAVAVVGSRNASFYGREQAKRLTRELADSGLTIVSGLAQGIDGIAHQACLDVPIGRTLAVLGCGVDVIYPRGHCALYEKIAERGAIISEYPLQTPPIAHNFPRRNRLISGLSLGVLVIEAHTRSGSLITARQSLEQGREVFALPGPVDQLTSSGTNQLLKEGAHLVTTGKDIVEVLALSLKPIAPAHARRGVQEKIEAEAQMNDPVPKSAILQWLSQRPRSYDELVHLSEDSPGAILSELTRLEIGGKIGKRPDGVYIYRR